MKKILVIVSLVGIVAFVVTGVFYKNWVNTHDVFSGSSMEPTLRNGQNLAITPYENGNLPKRGDIIEYKDAKYKKLVHRVVALPGERVAISKDTLLVFNTENPNGFTPEFQGVNGITLGSTELTLGEGQFFVLGDNRAKAYDSRQRGPVNLGDILGKVSISNLQKEQ